jgi:hypothetical protein
MNDIQDFWLEMENERSMTLGHYNPMIAIPKALSTLFDGRFASCRPLKWNKFFASEEWAMRGIWDPPLANVFQGAQTLDSAVITYHQPARQTTTYNSPSTVTTPTPAGGPPKLPPQTTPSGAKESLAILYGMGSMLDLVRPSNGVRLYGSFSSGDDDNNNPTLYDWFMNLIIKVLKAEVVKLDVAEDIARDRFSATFSNIMANVLSTLGCPQFLQLLYANYGRQCIKANTEPIGYGTHETSTAASPTKLAADGKESARPSKSKVEDQYSTEVPFYSTQTVKSATLTSLAHRIHMNYSGWWTGVMFILQLFCSL